MAIRIGLVGLGKIAHDQHLPAIARSKDYELIAGASLAGTSPGGRTYPSIEAMLAAEPDLDAVALCQPPQARFHAARAAIAAGKHVFLEKPPGATLGEVALLVEAAGARGVTLFTSWHSRHAPAVEPARAWLAGKTVRSVRIDWKEDVRVWHPGQPWIWKAGGLGVFDPGINALSIATHLLPPFFLEGGELFRPANCESPIRAHLRFVTHDAAPVNADFDFLHTGEQTWDIRIETDGGSLHLANGGHSLSIGGEAQVLEPASEYDELYRRFAQLVRAGGSEVDLRPLAHVADAFLRCPVVTVDPFMDDAPDA